jgi:hypothetical protein
MAHPIAGYEDSIMEHTKIIENVAARLQVIDGLKGLFLAGSYGKGTADSVSDLDFLAVIEDGAQDTVAQAMRDALETLEPVVMWRARLGAFSLINAITQSWERVDLFMLLPGAMGPRVQSGLAVLHDPDAIFDTLPASAPDYTPSKAKVAYLIDEFIRVLGLAHIALTRGEYVTLEQGLGLLRGMVSDLLQEDCPLSDRGGILHLSKLISKEDMTLLASLPYPGPDRDALIQAHIDVAEVFFPRARAMALRLDLSWPDTFEAATRANLQLHHGITFR